MEDEITFQAAPIPAPRDPEEDFELLEAEKRPLAAGRVNVNSRFWRGVTLVMLAAGYGHRKMVELLLGFRADMSLVDDDGDNILHFACWGGDVETVKFVLSHNIAIMNAMSKKTAVDLARHEGFQKVVELLMPYGAQ